MNKTTRGLVIASMALTLSSCWKVVGKEGSLVIDPGLRAFADPLFLALVGASSVFYLACATLASRASLAHYRRGAVFAGGIANLAMGFFGLWALTNTIVGAWGMWSFGVFLDKALPGKIALAGIGFLLSLLVPLGFSRRGANHQSSMPAFPILALPFFVAFHERGILLWFVAPGIAGLALAAFILAILASRRTDAESFLAEADEGYDAFATWILSQLGHTSSSSDYRELHARLRDAASRKAGQFVLDLLPPEKRVGLKALRKSHGRITAYLRRNILHYEAAVRAKFAAWAEDLISRGLSTLDEVPTDAGSVQTPGEVGVEADS